MELKVVCQCGQKYKFDVEPVNGRMPFPVNCPVCNLDGTSTANAMLAEILVNQPSPSAATPPPPPPPLAAPAPAGSGLRLTRPPQISPGEALAQQPPATPPRPMVSRPIAAVQPATDSRRKLEWYEHIWCALPLCLVVIGGAIGGACGGVAWAINREVFRKMKNPIARYLLTAFISGAAFGCYLAVAVTFVLLFHR